MPCRNSKRRMNMYAVTAYRISHRCIGLSDGLVLLECKIPAYLRYRLFDCTARTVEAFPVATILQQRDMIVLSAARQPPPPRTKGHLQVSSWRYSWRLVTLLLLLRLPSSSRTMGYSSQVSGDLNGEWGMEMWVLSACHAWGSYTAADCGG